MQVLRDDADRVQYIIFNTFQFFPSCCKEKYLTALNANCVSPFNSFPVAAEPLWRAWVCGVFFAFNSFPVAAKTSLSFWGSLIVSLSILSQLLPSRSSSRKRSSKTCRKLSILSQLLQAGGVPREVGARRAPFNSFPVAAEALASWLLINLSSAIFEVHEISLALSFDT